MRQKSARTLRVLIVSDVRVMQEGLRSVLAARDEVEVLSTADIPHAHEQSKQLHPDVILFDATRPDSIELLKNLVASAPDSKVVAFGVKETDDEILALAAAGTAGYVCNSAECSDVVSVLERVMSDELPCSARTAASLFRRVATLSKTGTLSEAGRSSVGSGAGDGGAGAGSAMAGGNSVIAGSNSPASAVPLSRRELQIAHLVDSGLTNKQIARELGIEASTVKNHVHNICGKLKVHRRGEAAALIRATVRAQERLRAQGLLLTAAPDVNPALAAGLGQA